MYIFFRHLRIWTWIDPDIYVYRPGMFQTYTYIGWETWNIHIGWYILPWLEDCIVHVHLWGLVLKQCKCPQRARYTCELSYIYIDIYTVLFWGNRTLSFLDTGGLYYANRPVACTTFYGIRRNMCTTPFSRDAQLYFRF